MPVERRWLGRLFVLRGLFSPAKAAKCRNLAFLAGYFSPAKAAKVAKCRWLCELGGLSGLFSPAKAGKVAKCVVAWRTWRS